MRGLEAYVDAIEALLTRRLGAERTLSPRDFALARSWHRAGVPLGDVLAVLEESFESGERVSSLAFCRSRVEARARVSSRPQRAESPAEKALRSLAVLGDSLPRLRSADPGVIEATLGKARGVEARLLRGESPLHAEIQAGLEAIDDEVDRVLLDGLSRAAVEAHRATAARALQRAQGRVDPAALEEALVRLAVAFERERLGLPRVGVVP